MEIIVLILLIGALVAFLVAGVLAHRAHHPWAMFVSVGLALWVLVQVIGAVPVG